MKPRRTPTVEAIQNVAITCASARYALEIWEGGDWAWYELLRELLLDAVDSGRIVRLTPPHRQFMAFVATHLAPHFPPGTPEQAIFTSRRGREDVRAGLQERGMAWNIDNCPVFD